MSIFRKWNTRGYEFAIHGDAEEDLFSLFAKLIERMRRALTRRHIEASNLTHYQITNENIIRGRITWDNDTDGKVPCLVIDGIEPWLYKKIIIVLPLPFAGPSYIIKG